MSEPVALKRELGLFSATTIVAGSMIGSGIFIVSADITRQLSSPGLLLLIWIFTAVITLLGALSFGKLAMALPRAGGQYVFLKEAWGELPAFLYGWALFFVIQTGYYAAVSVAFAKFLGVMLPWVGSHTGVTIFNLDISTQQLVAIAVITVLTIFNCIGVKEGATLQNIFTVLKAGALLILVGLGLTMIKTDVDWFGPGFFTPMAPLKPPGIPLISAFAVATVGAIFSSDAWNNVTFIASEVKNPEKVLPKAMAGGVLAVLVLYLFANIGYLNILPFEALQNPPEDRVATAALTALFGNSGAWAMASVILISTFGCVNGMILAGARVFYAMAQDGLFFKSFSYVHPKFQTPVVSLIGQGIFAALLTLSGSYAQLLDYIIFTTLLFYIVTVAGLLKLYKTRPSDFGHVSWVYKAIPIAYIVLVTYVAINLAIYKQNYTLPGLGIVALGIPIFWVWKRFYQKSN